MKLPAKRSRLRSRILREPPRKFPAHRRFIVKHECVVTLRVQGECDGDIVPAHIRTAGNAGTGLKPRDSFLVPLCHKHHCESHDGEETFERKYKLDLLALAAEFARRTTDQRLREVLRQLATHSAPEPSRASVPGRG